MINIKDKKEGYLLVEVFVAICISLTVLSTVSLMLSESMSLIKQTDNRIELMEQFSEMRTAIKREIRNSNNLRFYFNSRKISLTDEFTEIDRIKFSQFDDIKQGVTRIKERDMYISKAKSKIFILYNQGHYEIGNYVVKIEAKKESEDCFAIKLNLNKNNNHFSDIISIRLRN